MHTFFESDGEEVQREWVRFTAKIDKKVEGVLHHAVKRSLQELNRLLNGDSKTEVLPVFRWGAGSDAQGKSSTHIGPGMKFWPSRCPVIAVHVLTHTHAAD